MSRQSLSLPFHQSPHPKLLDWSIAHPATTPDAPSDQKVTMKKTTPKLVLRRETLRALAGIALTRAAGGGDALPRESGREGCHVQVAAVLPVKP